MNRRTELKRTTGLWPGSGLTRKPPAKRPPRRTGFPAAVRLAARERAGEGYADNARCEACGIWVGAVGGDLQHRLARGIGGTSSPVVNSVANAAVMCRVCHDLAESRDPEMEARGFWIRSGNGPEHDPRYVPVLLASIHGPGATVWLAESGYLAEPPQGVAA